MLQQLSTPITNSLLKSAAARQRADESTDESTRQTFLRLEHGWALLAESQAFSERLDRFIRMSQSSRRRNDFGPRDGSDGSQYSEGAKRHLICLVDDDESSRKGLRSLVRSLGYEGAAFATGDAYLHSGLVRDTACLISDVVMPGMDGFELHARLTDKGHAIPVIFVTGLADETVRRRAMQIGAVGLLVKPCKQELLVECLNRALAISR